ncbi:MAG: glycine dehydrogenase (aminomethyl-transferring) [Planctomycetia bacterium]|nr:glycine dehydrogenase (aminomethyl-transferring) [Planctomycetia bacterium]
MSPTISPSASLDRRPPVAPPGPDAVSAPPTLDSLERPAEFLARHIGPGEDDQRRMLATMGEASCESLVAGIVPPSIARRGGMRLPPPVTEAEALAELAGIASRNRLLKSFIGQGYHGTHTPAVILRNILENPAWYTAYTPYQAEISQGRMEAIVNFQTMICDLTAMPIANASLLDEATAAAEAMTLARRTAAATSRTFLVDRHCHPQTIEVLATRARPLGIDVVVGDVDSLLAAGECFGTLVQFPTSDGDVRDHRGLAERVHARQALLCVAADPLALTLLAPPGEWGADIVVGTTQRFGMPMGCGGPHAAFFACRDEFKRSMPGRLVGVSVDAHGRPAYRLALQTREQHIRREKATSNICTAQVLPAVVASMYAVYHGPEGLSRIARRVAAYTAILADGLARLGVGIRNRHAFDTLALETGDRTQELAARARDAGMNLRVLDARTLSISLDETTTRDDLRRLWGVFAAPGQPVPDPAAYAAGLEPMIPEALARRSPFLAHPVFGSHRDETSMLRYIRSLSDQDLALDRSMIPLGSCTMKLNATSEMIPITWPGFAGVHPFAPADQLQGYAQLERQLRDWLCEATGYAGLSLQPNAGSQGEYAGLLVIKAWQEARGQGHRTVCLIPSSAHGTNPASAQMAGMEVVVTGCDAQGNVDIDALRDACERHSDRLAAVMITYPSTHGVFESRIEELCSIVHQHGGRVYVDGANMNALVGIASPGAFGGDVGHLNLHKTFCIPHGGGGPGVGPVCVVEDLVPFLPGHATGGLPGGGVGAVSAAPLGNAAVLPISWMYCRMMGADGLRRATAAAILAANYVSTRLRGHYPTLYTGANGRVAHECILDLRPLKETSGVGAEDVAKRLIDYGFHAPTLSFPVPGTLMVEPTESEPLAELDRFVDAMIAIREEIRRIELGEWPRDDNPLTNAPHTAAAVVVSEWRHPYSRETAAFPLPSLRRRKYWPPVGRVDNVYGDRNLSCSCVPTSAWAEPAAVP